MSKLRRISLLLIVCLTWSSCADADLSDLQRELIRAIDARERATIMDLADSVGSAEWSSEEGPQFVRFQVYAYTIAGAVEQAETVIGDYLNAHEPEPELLIARGVLQEMQRDSGSASILAAYAMLSSEPAATVDDIDAMLEIYTATLLPASARDSERLAVFESSLSDEERYFVRLWRESDRDTLLSHAPLGFVVSQFVHDPTEADEEWWR